MRLSGEGQPCSVFVSNSMAHEIAKFQLKQANSFVDRTEAVEAAIARGMPLHEIEKYLDWLDASELQQGRKSGGIAKEPGRIERPAAG